MPCTVRLSRLSVVLPRLSADRCGSLTDPTRPLAGNSDLRRIVGAEGKHEFQLDPSVKFVCSFREAVVHWGRLPGLLGVSL